MTSVLTLDRKVRASSCCLPSAPKASRWPELPFPGSRVRGKGGLRGSWDCWLPRPYSWGPLGWVVALYSWRPPSTCMGLLEKIGVPGPPLATTLVGGGEAGSERGRHLPKTTQGISETQTLTPGFSAQGLAMCISFGSQF